MIILTNINGSATSSFWLGKYSKWKFTGESTEDLVVITKVIHSIEKMVHAFDPSKKMTVRLATDVKSSSDWSNYKIILPPHKLWEQPSFPNFAHIVDLWTAMALHEAGHIVLSNYLEDVEEKENHQFILMHLVEDFWIEQWISDQFPGYKPYLLSFKKYYFKNDVDLGTDHISQKINDLIYTVNNPGYSPLFLESREALILLKSEWEKAKDNEALTTWDRTEIADRIFKLLFPNGLVHHTTSETVSEIHLNNRKELEPTARSTQTEDVNLEVPSPFLLTGTVKQQQLIRFHKQVKEGKKISWASEQMMETWLKEESRFFSQSKKNVDSSIIMKPKITSEGTKMYHESYGRVKPYIFKLREKFKTVNTPRIYENLQLHQGSLDEEALHRTRFSTNIFKMVEERYDAIDEWEITLLIDQSRSTDQAYEPSMRTSQLKRYEVGIDIGVLFVEALKKLKPVHLKVYAFSTASHAHQLQLNELYTPDCKNSYGLGMIEPKGATPELMALKEITLQMNEHGKRNARKLIVVVSDGAPDCYTYGNGATHESEIKNWINKWTKRNFSFVHISLEEATKANQAYPLSIQFEQDYAYLINKIRQFIWNTLRK